MSVLLVLLGLTSIVGYVIWIKTADERRTTALRARQRTAERTVDREANCAKRAMNRAAGHGWRNLID